MNKSPDQPMTAAASPKSNLRCRSFLYLADKAIRDLLLQEINSVHKLIFCELARWIYALVLHDDSHGVTHFGENFNAPFICRSK